MTIACTVPPLTFANCEPFADVVRLGPTAPLAKTLTWDHVGSEAGGSSWAQTRRVTHAEDYRRRPGFHGWRHASARRVDRGSDQGIQVRRLGDALFKSRVRR